SLSLHTPSCFIGGIARIRTCSAFIAINLVTMEARVGNDAADFADCLLVPRLRRLISGLTSVRQFDTELDPFGIVDRNRFPVLAPPSRRQHQRRRLGQSNSGVIDQFPTFIDIGAPEHPIEAAFLLGTPTVGGRLLRAGIHSLYGENDVRTWKKNAPHDLSEIAGRRKRRRLHRGRRRFRLSTAGGGPSDLLQRLLVSAQLCSARRKLAGLKYVGDEICSLLPAECSGVCLRHGVLDLAS